MGFPVPGGPVIGHFAISDLLTPAVQENIVPIPYHPDMINTNFTPRKIEPFHVSDGVHLIVLLDAKFSSDSVKKVLVDIVHGFSPSYWQFVYGCYYPFNENTNTFYCDDIAVTDNYVFLVGHKRCSAGIYMRIFNKPTSCNGSLNNIFVSLSTPNIYDEIYYYVYSFGGNINVLGDALGDYPVYCTHTIGDNVAIACMASYFDGSTFTYGTSVKNINVTSMSIMNEAFHPFSTTLNHNWKVRDLRFNGVTQTILMLNDIDNPSGGTLQSVVTKIDYPALTTATSSWPYVKTLLHSMDKFNNIANGVASCGQRIGYNSELVICHNKTITATPCFALYNPAVIPWGGGIRSFTVVLTIRYQHSNSTYTVATPIKREFTVLCSGYSKQ